MNPADITPVHDYGDLPISPRRAERMRRDDADCYRSVYPSGYTGPRQWTQHEALHAIQDRHVLLFALSRALEQIEELIPKQVTTIEDLAALPGGSIVLDDVGEVDEKMDAAGGAYWMSPGDDHHYRDRQIPLPATIIRIGEADE